MMWWDVLHKGPIVLLTSANLEHWIVKPRFLNSQLMVNDFVESCFESPCYAVYILKLYLWYECLIFINFGHLYLYIPSTPME